MKVSTWIIAASLANLSLGSMLAQNFQATDLIECKREKPENRQFCYVRSNQFDLNLALPKAVTFAQYTFKISEVIQHDSIAVELEGNEQGNYYIQSLEPILKYEVDWSNNPECSRSTLWNHNIFARTGASLRTGLTAGKVNSGLNGYDINLASLSTQAVTPWSIQESGQDIKISTTFSVFDADYIANQPLPEARIPASCKMKLKNLRLTFDPRAVTKDFANLKITARDKVLILAQASVVHANLIDSRRGAQCSALNLGNTLRQVEVLGESDPWDNLSLTSREAINVVLRKSKSLGAFANVAEDQLWTHFITADTQSELEKLCDPTVLPDYTISTAPFMNGDIVLNAQGVNNATTFAQEKRNLRRILEASWALTRTSLIGIQTGGSASWLNEVGLYAFLDKDPQP